MYTDQTLDIFDGITTAIGEKICYFSTTTCDAFLTKELQQETEAQQCCVLKKNTRQDGSALPKKFNIHTIKNHSLGDYPNKICCFGTTDSFSTELVSVFFC